MPALRRLALSVLGLCAAGTFVVSPAQADEGDLSIGHVQPGDGTLEVLVSVPPQVELGPGDLQVAVGGTTLNSTARPADESGDSIRRTTILAIDTSKSMAKQGRIGAAKEAAALFLESVPDDVYVGIVTFDSKVRTALAPTQDRDAAATVVDGLDLRLQTRLNDGVIAAVKLAGDEGQRRLLVLSDGKDTSRTAESDVTTAIKDAEVGVDVVALDQKGGDSLLPLRAMSDAGDGAVISADAEALEEAFSKEADALARQVLVTAEMPASITASEDTVTVSVDTGDGVKTASAYAVVRDASSAASQGLISPDTGPLFDVSRPVMLGGVVAIGVAMLLFLSSLVGARRVQVSDAESRILAYGSGGAGAPGGGGPRADASLALTQVKQATGRMLRRNRGLEQRIATRLEAAGSALKPAEWLLLHGGIVMLAGVVGLMLSGANFLMMMLFVLGGILVPWLWLGFRRKRRVKAFSGSLADTLQLISGSLSAGLSLAQSLDTVVKEGNEPIAGEFKRVLIESRLGVPLDECLDAVAVRMDSKDFAWVVMAIRIQREVGGNLAELLNTVAATMREREYLRRQVATLSAEGKISAYILGGLPPAMLCYMLAVRRDYVMPLFTETLGLMMLAGACSLLAFAAFLMSRIVKVEVLDMVLVFGAAMIFAALFMVFAAFGSMSARSSGVTRSLEMLEGMGSAELGPVLTSELERPFGERVLDPLLQRVQKLGRRLTGADQEERIRRWLDRSGNPAGWTVDRVASGRVLGAIVGCGFGAYFWLILGWSLPVGLLAAGGGLALGFQAPIIYLYNTATKRDGLILKSLADAIDLLTISVEAGLGFDAALQQVARNTEGPLAGEFQRVLQEMQIGRGRSDSLRALGERTKLADLRSFVSAMVQADSFGIPIGQVLRVQSHEIRTKRRQRAEEKAGQVPVKIMIPVILFVLPCLLIVVMGPAIISVMGSFG